MSKLCQVLGCKREVTRMFAEHQWSNANPIYVCDVHGDLLALPRLGRIELKVVRAAEPIGLFAPLLRPPISGANVVTEAPSRFIDPNIVLYEVDGYRKAQEMIRGLHNKRLNRKMEYLALQVHRTWRRCG